jgi:hypothetical protein
VRKQHAFKTLEHHVLNKFWTAEKMRLQECGYAVAKQYICGKRCRYAVAEVLPSSCGAVIAVINKNLRLSTSVKDSGHTVNHHALHHDLLAKLQVQ